ncbi:MAG TPA: DUF3108 domain-containing protein [Blastocatellia bacterium]|nr:DUF3108 domain-containing protein [Blastocatellia bacterium]
MFKSSLVLIPFIALTVVAGVKQKPDVKFDRPSATASSLKSAFAVGEKFTYEVSWQDFLVAGELVIETKDRRSYEGVDGYHVSAHAQSVGLVSMVGKKIDDGYESFIDASTLLPFRAEKRMRHGKNSSQSSVTIDQEHRTARLADGRSVRLPGETYDLASLLFAIRGMDLTPGKARNFNLLEDDKLYAIKIEPEAKEKITTQAGSFDTIRIATRMADRANDKLSNLRIYVTNDQRRIPVLITAEPSWGGVRVQLVSATPQLSTPQIKK